MDGASDAPGVELVHTPPCGTKTDDTIAADDHMVSDVFMVGDGNLPINRDVSNAV